MVGAVITITFSPEGEMDFHCQSNATFGVLESYLARARAEIERQIAAKGSCPYAPIAAVGREGLSRKEQDAKL